MRRVPDSNYPVRDLFGKGKHGFGHGDKTNGTIATIPGAAFMNAVQEEIANAIEGMGIELDPENNTQLLDALRDRVAARLDSIEALRAFRGGLVVKIVQVAGYYADKPGLGGGVFVADASDNSSVDDGGTVIVSVDQIRWKRSDKKLNAEMFGAIGDGKLHLEGDKSVDTIAIQRFIDYANNSGSSKTCNLQGYYIINDTIILKSHAYLVGTSSWTTRIDKATGFNGDALKTERFDVLKNLNNTLADLPFDFGIVNIKFDGNYISSDDTTYINTSGGGLKIIGTQFELITTVFNQAGVGVYLGGLGAETADKYRDGRIQLRVDTTRDEGLIYIGPPDLKIDSVFCRRAGALLANDPKRWTLWATENYPSKQRVDAIVLETGAEIELIHSWGHEVGYGLAVNSGRINANLIICESALGGVDLQGDAYGMVDKLRCHNIKGGVAYQSPPHKSAGTMPSVNYNTTGHFAIATLSLQRSGSGQTGQDEVRIERGRLIVGNLTLNGQAKNGHGVVHNGGVLEVANVDIDNIAGKAADGTNSAAIISNATGQYAYKKLSGFLSNCDVGLRQRRSLDVEQIDLQMRSVATPWEGEKRSKPGQRWRIDSAGSVNKSSRFIGAVEFDPLSTETQKVKIAHGLLYAPNIANVQISVADSPTSIVDSPAEFANVTVYDIDDNYITIGIKLKVAGNQATTPRVNIYMEL